MNRQKSNPTIVGAGLAGLIAAHAWPNSQVVEIAPNPVESHKALLRFRTEAVSHLTGIEFKRVQVRKGIWEEGAFHQPDIRRANMYARKVLPGLGLSGGERSIWSIDPVDRFVAPDDFYDRMIERVGLRIQWGCRADFLAKSSVTLEAGPFSGPFISTAPLPALLKDLQMVEPTFTCNFARAPITVERYVIPGADLYQTIYFPGGDTKVYRASMTGSALIIEYAGNIAESWDIRDLSVVFEAFGLGDQEMINIGVVEQKYGKIVEIEPAIRRNLLFRLTNEYGIYSLGRFATWRNLLLDDVVKDIAVIRRLLAADNAYETRLAALV